MPTLQDQRSGESRGEVYYMSGRYGRSVAFKVPRLCSGVEDSPVVNNSRIE